jgi:hypothetical protein
LTATLRLPMKPWPPTALQLSARPWITATIAIGETVASPRVDTSRGGTLGRITPGLAAGKSPSCLARLRQATKAFFNRLIDSV